MREQHKQSSKKVSENLLNTNLLNTNDSSNIKYYYDVTSSNTKDLIEKTIKSNGFSVEHDYFYFLSNEEPGYKPVFVYFGENKGLMAFAGDNGIWKVLSEIMAPEVERAKLCIQFAKNVFREQNCRKLYLEFYPRLRLEMIKLLKETNDDSIIVGNNTYTYYEPLVNLSLWDPSLNGSSMSTLRKAKNRFQRNYKIELIEDENARNIDFKELKTLVINWKNNRKGSDRAEYRKYLTFFKDKFLGANKIFTIRINDKLCAVGAGWDVVNSDKMFYFAISLHDYSIPELGDFLNCLFFDKMKKDGYKTVDFGASGDSLLKYKEKFGAKTNETIYCFYVRKK